MAKAIVTLISLALLLVPAPSRAASEIPGYVAAAVADPGRSAEEKQRDVLRKPAEVIAFAGLKPGDKVADIWPGRRHYYTRILSKVVGPTGKVYVVWPAETVAVHPEAVDITKKMFAASGYENISPIVTPVAAIAAPEKLDMIWVSQIYHDFPSKEFGPADIPKLNKALFDALKPGGVLLVTDHATAPGAGTSVTENLHRIDPDWVKRQVQAAGFVLEAQSDLLRNPQDAHSLASLDDSMHDKTDQFLFRFRKPR